MKKMTLGALALSVASAPLTATAGGADLTVFDWSGYEDTGFFGSYMEEYNEAPSYTFFGSQEEAFTKLQSGFTADLAHPCSDAVRKWVAADLIKPLDPAKLDHWDALLPQIKEVDGIMIDGEVYMMPFEWGNTGLIYRTDKIADDAISLQLLADPAYQGKVAIPDAASSAYALAALATGNAADYTKMSDEQFQEASDYLRKVHPNVRFYWSDAGQMDQAMASGELEMGWAWNQSELNLIWNDTPAKMMRDVDKGIATWVCGYVHLKSSTASDDQVYDLLNALSAKESGKYIIESWGYPHGNAEAFEIADQELIATYGFDDVDQFFEGSLFFDAVDPALEARMLKEFERIKSGF
ncbi:ABC transporter substrate-binding protein [Roseovarius nubinhibens]|uniref:Spermidine/putrescine-binding protein n=1 Tax=Roseovarius nubinhibens (strain ATCC BAA-591 / DSM 15170 / ISM) TaxID=89187 RepID=A3SJQ5_ROSNI|nr:extracellular solute-binding protein [Roseovarius nubinhibens]EAP77586.1 spermidine/putrescine-binding protein [Roseovarius nubinhibens ISM]